MELLSVWLGASVSEFSVAVGYHPGDDSFHGWSVLVVAGQGFGVFESVAGFGQEPVVWVYFEGASSGVSLYTCLCEVGFLLLWLV